MNTGDIVQHLKVGKARLVCRIEQGMYSEKWAVQFITGPHRNKGTLNIWIKEENIVEHAAPAPAPVEAEVASVAVEVTVTPAMAEILSAYRGASESLCDAEDAGVCWTTRKLSVPVAGRAPLLSFVRMMAEIAADNLEDGYGSPAEKREWRARISLRNRVVAALSA